MLSDWATLFLALLLVPVLVLETAAGDTDTQRLAVTLNAIIWFAFALDYGVDVWRTSDRRAYIASHWFDLALVVVSPPLLVPPEAQALRVLRILRLARVAALIGVVAERLDRPLARGAAGALVAVIGLVVLAGGVLITAAEPASFPNVARGYAWTIATLVTAGHTTPEPTTAAGHAISTAIIVVGLASIAALAASIGGRTPRAMH